MTHCTLVRDLTQGEQSEHTLQTIGSYKGMLITAISESIIAFRPSLPFFGQKLLRLSRVGIRKTGFLG